MAIEFSQAKKVLDDFHKEVSEYIDTHELRELPSYSKLQDKEVIGDLYRDDQFYYETISTYRADYYALKTFFLKQKTDKTDRGKARELDSIDKLIESRIKHLETLSLVARQRVKFYENIIYLVSNMGYGDY